MRPQLIRVGFGLVALAWFAGAPPAVAIKLGTLAPSTADAMAQASPQAIAEYRRKLKEYQEARAAFDEEAGDDWTSISEKRSGPNAKPPRSISSLLRRASHLRLG